MFARLTALVGSGSALPFDLLEPNPSAWGHWTHYNATLKADGSSVSVFRMSATNENDPKLQAARNGVKRLRTLRHPNILSFKDTVECEEKGETVVYIVTEAVAPLTPTLRTLNLTGASRDQYLSMGLHQVVSAISFLNNDCKLIHGHLCAAAVVVTDTLDWKLHGFDLTSEHEAAGGGAYNFPLTASSWAMGGQYKSGEVGKGDWNAVHEGPPWAVDAWGLGCLMQELFSGSTLARTEDLRNTDAIPAPLLQYYQRLLASQPARRLNPGKMAEAGVLRTKMVELMGFLENLSLKDSAEKDSFFKKLPAVLPNVPDPVARRKLLPLLAGALEFGGAPPSALGTLLKIGERLPEGDAAKQLTPILSKLFVSTDRGIRRALLENVHIYGPNLPAAAVEESIYPHVQAGFTDSNPYLRELTLKSMLILGPKLAQKTLNQGLLKHLAKLQVDEEPAIRANTTVLLGNLAPLLSEATCKKVLLNAFTRALKDPFPPARVAGLKAIFATAKYYAADEAAVRVLPVVAPLCVDQVGEVRACALQCLDHFRKVLEGNHEAAEKRAAATGAVPGGAGAAAAPAGQSGGGSMLTSFGWAVSSMVARGGAPDVPAPSKPVGFGSDAVGSSGMGGQARPAAAAAALPSSRNGGTAASSSSMHASSVSRDWDEPAPAAPGVEAGNGWEGDDDPLEDMMDAVAEEKQARQKLARAAVSKPSAAAPRKTGGDEGAGAGARRPAGGAVGARRPGSGAPGAGGRRPAGGTGMKLGGKKLGAADASFDEW